MSIKYKNNGTWVEAPVNVIQKSDLPEEAFNLTGNCDYRFGNGGWDWFIREYGNKITTNNISSCSYMFKYSTVDKIPFSINMISGIKNISYLFQYANNLKSVPKITATVENIKGIFEQCTNLRHVSDDVFDGINWYYADEASNYNYSYSCDRSSMFKECYSLRSYPNILFTRVNTACTYSYSALYYGFNNCWALDEVINLPIPYKATWTSNAFYYTFNYCYRLKNAIFALDPATNTPYVKNWKSQTIDLSSYVGYGSSSYYFISYNSGITADKEVKDDATYQALKNDPDWFATKIEYSRYNHDSAVATINSLPDTSAYLAANGGTNTIKFKGTSGSATDGGAINTLTAEEIAVATAKGWTVTLV
jgi:hypothetical protein